MPRKKKVREPKEYDGSKDVRVIDNFFWHMKRYFDALDLDEEGERVKTTVMYLRDTAALWWMKHFKNREVRRIRTWDEFQKEFKRQFYLESVEDLALINLRRLRQKGSIRDYVKEYSTLMLEVPEMPEKQKLCFFIDGLQT